MNPSNIWFQIEYRQFHCIVDGAILPDKHKGHWAKVLEHIPKCCNSDYSHKSRVMCECGEELVVSDQFLKNQWEDFGIGSE